MLQHLRERSSIAQPFVHEPFGGPHPTLFCFRMARTFVAATSLSCVPGAVIYTTAGGALANLLHSLGDDDVARMSRTLVQLGSLRDLANAHNQWVLFRCFLSCLRNNSKCDNSQTSFQECFTSRGTVESFHGAYTREDGVSFEGHCGLNHAGRQPAAGPPCHRRGRTRSGSEVLWGRSLPVGRRCGSATDQVFVIASSGMPGRILSDPDVAI